MSARRTILAALLSLAATPVLACGAVGYGGSCASAYSAQGYDAVGGYASYQAQTTVYDSGWQGGYAPQPAPYAAYPAAAAQGYGYGYAQAQGQTQLQASFQGQYPSAYAPVVPYAQTSYGAADDAQNAYGQAGFTPVTDPALCPQEQGVRVIRCQYRAFQPRIVRVPVPVPVPVAVPTPQPVVYQDSRYVRLSDSFFYGDVGGVGPTEFVSSGGGGGYIAVGAPLSAGARAAAYAGVSASARASASVSIRGRGHGARKSGCGCGH